MEECAHLGIKKDSVSNSGHSTTVEDKIKSAGVCAYSLISSIKKTLVRPQLEYASTVWYHHTTTDINKVEAVQTRAARWATRDYRYTSRVTAMLKDLNWRPLDQRRIDSRLVMM